MNEADAFEVVRQAIWTIIIAAGPAVGAAMLVGIGIALFQALTQIQEVTLTFIPKIIVILLMTAISAPFIGAQIFAFTNEVYGRIATGF
ncbi:MULTISPECIES: flagellar biosynthesis protein FliQ [Hyphomicrobiales]|uniref:Flagellar biosynthetic protein FliQ n=1 Tax=Rhodopseudomonas julia TaxID=200617 RepID=A0ABU0C6Y0_9BRAD|nr:MULTISPECIES: flagellar biosynthesis protein FliQ [Hyphomicrobiales]MCF1503845.1 flagellar biosynthetic protein FliQ [Afifella sp. H1R]MCT8267855.1 flagellar biosynthesis protein FliQ [Afifella sp. JA880]MDQ0326279.1 flagellar biosynthetic protein FliQ [Rhodopseudomonas julia]